MRVNSSVIVLIGAISYGIPASVFKLATNSGVLPANLLVAQVCCAALILMLINLLRQQKRSFQLSHLNRSKLFLSGLAMASTNSFYFASLQYVSVTVSAVLLMQSVWIAMLLGLIFKRNIPSRYQIWSVVLIMIGTVLATQLLSSDLSLSWIGVLLGFGSAIAYAGTIMATNAVAKEADPIQRATYVSFGASFFLLLFWGYKLDFQNIGVTLHWAPVIAIFTAVLPLICFSKGMPALSPSLGGILSSIELPSAIIFAYLLLGEKISLLQVIGILIILFAIILPNIVVVISKKRLI
ncbi:DMT family transporter [Ignatzschineria rhizosphaerae]|uniref:DMT family transporter n=1 Tax=Ignatzschineria rhizosphaerae TaxID=2923279 RepID=A0ABY3X242_9GAMM|nr:DMT family transporter [Ignatzschineria rhizosphaerae]UNM96899.1 DMT family transporter [Ignatzschineria rhizosphaerae]